MVIRVSDCVQEMQKLWQRLGCYLYGDLMLSNALHMCSVCAHTRTPTYTAECFMTNSLLRTSLYTWFPSWHHLLPVWVTIARLYQNLALSLKVAMPASWKAVWLLNSSRWVQMSWRCSYVKFMHTIMLIHILLWVSLYENNNFEKLLSRGKFGN